MNVVLIIIDSLQKNYIGAYGNNWVKTPNLDRLASESCIFTRAYPDSLPTLPARIAIHAGRKVYPFKENFIRKGDMILQPGWGPIPEDWITVSEVLKEKGYRTALITDTFHQFKPGKNFHRGFDQYLFIRGQDHDVYISGSISGRRVIEDFYVKPIGEFKEQKDRLKRTLDMYNAYFRNTARRESEEDYFAPMVFREASKWLCQNQDTDNFFLVVDSFDPHEPWDPPIYYRQMYDPENDMEKDIIWSTYSASHLLTDRQIRRLRANYAGEITMVDRWMGYFVHTLEYMNLSNKTLLILLSDHGHLLGEKNLIGKFPYPILPEAAELVLLVRNPMKDWAGKNINDFVYDFDIAPTILSFLGIEPPEEMEGENLIPVIEGKRQTRRVHVTTGWQNNVMVRTDEFWYTGRLDKSEEMLFSLKDDPEFKKNLALEEGNICEEMHDLAIEDAGGHIPEYVLNYPKYSVYGGVKW